MEDLIKALKELLSDIESMQDNTLHDSNWFGPFSEFAEESDTVSVEWPNLIISYEKAKNMLEIYEHDQRNQNNDDIRYL